MHPNLLKDRREQESSMHSIETTDLHINLTEGNKLETQHWLLGFITNLEASKEERGVEGCRNNAGKVPLYTQKS